MKAPSNRFPRGKPSTDPLPPEPIFCTHGDTLCKVLFWTEAEWDRLDPAQRPEGTVHKAGSGWIATVRVNSLS